MISLRGRNHEIRRQNNETENNKKLRADDNANEGNFGMSEQV
jgi:hypothetical protein